MSLTSFVKSNFTGIEVLIPSHKDIKFCIHFLHLYY